MLISALGSQNLKNGPWDTDGEENYNKISSEDKYEYCMNIVKIKD